MEVGLFSFCLLILFLPLSVSSSIVRYMLFINKNRPHHDNTTTPSVSTLIPPVAAVATKMQVCNSASVEEKITEEDNKENNNYNKQQPVAISLDGKVVKKDVTLSSALSKKKLVDTRKRKHVASSDRRGTLSPNSARSMALSACEENSHHSVKSLSTKTKQALSSNNLHQHKKEAVPVPPSRPASSSSLTRKTTVSRRRETISTDLFAITDEEIELINRNSQSPSEEKKSVTPSNDDVISPASTTSIDDLSLFNNSVMEEVPLISLDDEIQQGLLPPDLPLEDMGKSVWSMAPPLLSPLKPITTPLKPISTKKIPLKSPLQILSDHLNDSSVKARANSFSSSAVLSLYPPVPPLSSSKNILSEKFFAVPVNNEFLVTSAVPTVTGADAIDELDFLSMLTSNSTRSYTEETDNFCISSSEEMKQWEEMKAMEDSESSSVEMVVETPVSSEPVLEDKSAASVDDFIKTMTYYQQYYLSLPELMQENDYERIAKQRMHERFVTARNQFQWEMVSIQAANSAILRAKILYETK
jgi:hypothetical protein